MKDYLSLLSQWLEFNDQDLSKRKTFIDSLHIEVRKAFDVITRISLEELNHYIKELLADKIVNDSIEESLAFCVYAGYTLFLTEHSINLSAQNMIAKHTTNILGDMWIEHYEKDQHKSFFTQIDPIVSMMLEKVAQLEINTLLYQLPQIAHFQYKQVEQINAFLNWATNQGYIIGLIEQELSKKD
jgi:hypothetical protein